MRTTLAPLLMMWTIRVSLSDVITSTKDTGKIRDFLGIVRIGPDGIGGAAALMDAVGAGKLPSHSIFIAASASSARRWNLTKNDIDINYIHNGTSSVCRTNKFVGTDFATDSTFYELSCEFCNCSQFGIPLKSSKLIRTAIFELPVTISNGRLGHHERAIVKTSPKLSFSVANATGIFSSSSSFLKFFEAKTFLVSRNSSDGGVVLDDNGGAVCKISELDSRQETDTCASFHEMELALSRLLLKPDASYLTCTTSRAALMGRVYVNTITFSELRSLAQVLGFPYFAFASDVDTGHGYMFSLWNSSSVHQGNIVSQDSIPTVNSSLCLSKDGHFGVKCSGLSCTNTSMDSGDIWAVFETNILRSDNSESVPPQISTLQYELVIKNLVDEINWLRELHDEKHGNGVRSPRLNIQFTDEARNQVPVHESEWKYLAYVSSVLAGLISLLFVFDFWKNIKHDGHHEMSFRTSALPSKTSNSYAKATSSVPPPQPKDESTAGPKVVIPSDSKSYEVPASKDIFTVTSPAVAAALGTHESALMSTREYCELFGISLQEDGEDDVAAEIMKSMAFWDKQTSKADKVSLEEVKDLLRVLFAENDASWTDRAISSAIGYFSGSENSNGFVEKELFVDWNLRRLFIG